MHTSRAEPMTAVVDGFTTQPSVPIALLTDVGIPRLPGFGPTLESARVYGVCALTTGSIPTSWIKLGVRHATVYGTLADGTTISSSPTEFELKCEARPGDINDGGTDDGGVPLTTAACLPATAGSADDSGSETDGGCTLEERSDRTAGWQGALLMLGLTLLRSRARGSSTRADVSARPRTSSAGLRSRADVSARRGLRRRCAGRVRSA